MNIETFVSIKPTIQNGKLIIIFESNDNIITELRVLKVADEIHKLLEELKSDKIKEFYFLFQVDNIKIPTNFSYIEEIALSLFKYKDLIIQKLNFSVVQCKNNIFRMFFSLFKKYYTPIKELYLAKSYEDALKGLHDETFRSSLPNLSTEMNKNE